MSPVMMNIVHLAQRLKSLQFDVRNLVYELSPGEWDEFKAEITQHLYDPVVTLESINRATVLGLAVRPRGLPPGLRIIDGGKPGWEPWMPPVLTPDKT